MKLSDFPESFQEWIKDQNSGFDTFPKSLKLTMIKRYREEMKYKMRCLEEDRERVLSMALHNISAEDVKFLPDQTF